MAPQNPYPEQQAPKTEPRHVWPEVAPHDPSTDEGRARVGVLAGGDIEDVEDVEDETTILLDDSAATPMNANVGKAVPSSNTEVMRAGEGK